MFYIVFDELCMMGYIVTDVAEHKEMRCNLLKCNIISQILVSAFPLILISTKDLYNTCVIKYSTVVYSNVGTSVYSPLLILGLLC